VGCHWHFLQGCRLDPASCGTPRIAIQGSFALRYVKMPVPKRTAVDGALVCLVPLIAVGEALQCLDIEKFDLIAGRQLDQPKLLELCEVRLTVSMVRPRKSLKSVRVIGSPNGMPGIFPSLHSSADS